MVLEKLGSGLKDALYKIARKGYVDKAAIDELVRDIQRVLLTSDVSVELVSNLTKNIRKKSLEEKPLPGMTVREHVIKIVYEELVKFIGKKSEIKLNPKKILFIGLYGSGKTSSIGKIANFYRKRGLKTAMIGCDIHRAAAMDQISQIAAQLKIPVYAPKDIKDPIKIAKNGIRQFAKKYDILIFDSAGRDALDKQLAKELKGLGKVINPEEVLLVIPADLGQVCGNQAAEFNKLVGITGVFLTKLDGTAKGGGAITACAITNTPVKFIGTGEKMDDMDIFEPQRFVSRLIGYGDIQGLLEKAKSAGIEVSEEKAKDFLRGEFTLKDFQDQIRQMQKLGPLKRVMDMIPGASGLKLPKDFLDVQEDKMKKWKYMIDSMNPEERNSPDIINSSRARRIAKGSGTKESEVRELLKYYKQAKKVMKLAKGGKGLKRGPLAQLAKQFGMGAG